MAAIYKATKVIQTSGVGTEPNTVRVQAYWENPTVSPRAVGAVAIFVSPATAEVPATIQSQINLALTSLGPNTIDWTK